MKLGEWPGFHGLRLLMLWVVLVFVVFGWRHYWRVSQAMADEAPRERFHLGLPLLIAFGPPVLFAAGYSLVRRRSGKS